MEQTEKVLSAMEHEKIKHSFAKIKPLKVCTMTKSRRSLLWNLGLQ